MRRVVLAAVAVTTLVSARANAAVTCANSGATFPGTTPEGVWCADTKTSVLQGPLGLAQFSEPNVYVAAATGVLGFTEASGAPVGGTPFFGLAYGASVSTRIVPAHFTLSDGGAAPQGVLLFGATDGYLYNVDAGTGTCLWRTFLGRTGRTDIVDVGCSKGDLQNPCGDQITAEPALYVPSDSDVSEAQVFIGMNDGALNSCSQTTANRVYSVNVKTGVPTWTFNSAGNQSVAQIAYAVGPDVYKESACATNRNQIIVTDNAGTISLLDWQSGNRNTTKTGLLNAGYAPAGYMSLAYSSSKCGAAFIPAVNGSTGEIAQISFDATAGGACGGAPPCAATLAGITIPGSLTTPLSMNLTHQSGGSILTINSAGNDYLESATANCKYMPTSGAIATPFVLSTPSGAFAYTGTKEGSLVQIPITGQSTSGGACVNTIERFVSATTTTTLGDPGADFTSSGSAYIFTGDTGGRVSEVTTPFTGSSLIANVSGLTAAATIHFGPAGASSLTATANGLYVVTQTAGTNLVTATASGETCTVNGLAAATLTLTATADINVAVVCTPAGGTPYTLSVNVTDTTGTIGSASGLVIKDANTTPTSSQTITPSGTGTFSFAYQLATGTKYTVSINTQPTDGSGILCATSGSATGTIAGAVTVNVICGCTTGDTQCGGVCVNTATSATNCGGCGLNCTGTGATCSNSACQRTSSQPFPGQLTADSSNLYWANGGSDVIEKLAKSGGTAAQLGASLPAYGHGYTTQAYGVATDGTNVYYTAFIENGASLYGGYVGQVGISSPFTEVSCSDIPGSGFYPQFVVTDGTSVFWSDYTAVRKAPIGTLACNTSTKVTSAGVTALALSKVNGILAYADQSSSGSVFTVSSAFIGSPTTIATAQNTVYNMTTDDTNFYWTTLPGTGGTVAYSSVTGSGPATVLWNDSSHAPYSIAADGTNVYWGTRDGYVYKMAIGDAAPTLMAHDSDGTAIVGIIVDATSVFWSDASANTINSITPK